MLIVRVKAIHVQLGVEAMLSVVGRGRIEVGWSPVEYKVTKTMLLVGWSHVECGV